MGLVIALITFILLPMLIELLAANVLLNVLQGLAISSLSTILAGISLMNKNYNMCSLFIGFALILPGILILKTIESLAVFIEVLANGAIGVYPAWHLGITLCHP